MTKTARELRRDARAALADNGQYWRYVPAYLFLTLIVMVMSVPVLFCAAIGIAWSGIGPFFAPGGKPEAALFLDPSVMLPLSVTAIVIAVIAVYPIGFVKWAQASLPMATMRRGVRFGHALSGWGHGWKMGWIELVKWSYLTLWYMLLIVPGIMKSLSYAMTEFVAVDHPEWSAKQCIRESCRLMAGNRMRLLLLALSFIGWWLLVVMASALVPFIGNMLQFFFIPYPGTAIAAFYEELLDADEASAQNPDV